MMMRSKANAESTGLSVMPYDSTSTKQLVENLTVLKF